MAFKPYCTECKTWHTTDEDHRNPVVTDEMIRVACSAYGASQKDCEFEWMREALEAALQSPTHEG